MYILNIFITIHNTIHNTITMRNIDIPILSVGIITAAFLRAVMAPLPNIEPVLLFTIVAGFTFGPIYGFLFAFSTMIISDFLILLPGIWSLYTSFTYGLMGFMVGIAGICKREWKRSEITLLSIFMILMYDTITAFFWSLNFMIPLQTALISQIPFTELHLVSCTLVFLFAPSLIRYVENIRSEYTTRHIRLSTDLS